MKIQSTAIRLSGLRFYSYHGVLPQEIQVGGWFQVDVTLNVQIDATALQVDALEGTVNYAEVYAVLKKEMKQPSKLIENAAWRIVNALFRNFEKIESIELTLSKENPPITGEVANASIRICAERD